VGLSLVVLALAGMVGCQQQEGPVPPAEVQTEDAMEAGREMAADAAEAAADMADEAAESIAEP